MNTHIRAEYKHIVENDIREQSLLFHCNDVAFEAKVTFTITPFANQGDSFWFVDLVKPVIKTQFCRGYKKIFPHYKEESEVHFSFDYQCKAFFNEINNTLNVYSLAKDEIIYTWFNQSVIEKYKNKVKVYQTALEKKYQSNLESDYKKRIELRKQLKNKDIDIKIYQKQLSPVNKDIGDIKYKILSSTERYSKRYFKCCQLKDEYRLFSVELTSSCLSS